MGNITNVKQDVNYNERSSEEAGRSTKTVDQVRKKLLKAYEYKDRPNQLEDLAIILSDKDKIKEKYFTHLIDKMKEAIQLVKDERHSFPDGIRNKATRDDFVERVEDAVSPVRRLKVKLILYEVNTDQLKAKMAQFVHDYFHEFTFGPFHAAIHIDNVVLEWGPSSLVIPKISDVQPHKMSEELSTTPVLVTDLHENKVPRDVFSEIKVGAGKESTEEALGRVINEVIDLTLEKECLIDELAEVVFRYNTKQHYGVLTNNCHHFVVDVLSVLGITDHMEAFKGKIKNCASIVISRDERNRTALEFNSHRELDKYVRENLQTMEKDDIEFCYCNYLLFHAWALKYPGEIAREWACPGDCMCETLAKQVA